MDYRLGLKTQVYFKDVFSFLLTGKTVTLYSGTLSTAELGLVPLAFNTDVLAF